MNESQENLLQELDSTLDILLKIDLTEHDMLFACEEDSTPMEFCMNPSSDIKISNILKKLSSLVDICGGNLKFNFLGGGSNSIKLVRKGEAIFCKNDDLFFSDYLIDCLSDRKLKDLNTYRVNKTNFDSNVNVMDILNKKKTWDEAKRKSTSDGEISDFDSDEETFVRKQSNAGSIRKNLYTKEEEMNILNFIIKKKVFSSVKSRQLWQVMERKKICGNRTWQSMKERFIKYIVPKIKTYHLNDTDESYILQGFKHSNCYQTRYKYHDIDTSNTDEENDEHNLESKASESYNDRHGLKNCLIKFTDPILNKSADQIIPDSDTDINDALIRNADNVIALHGLDCDNVKNSEIEHEIMNKNSPNHKDRPKLIEPADVSNLSEVITPDESDMSTEESDMSTVESDVVLKKSDRNETDDIYNSSSESTLSDSDEIILPTSKEKNQQKYTLTFHEKYGYKKKLMGQNWNGGEDECKFSIAEDISIIQYISKHKEIENIFGRKMWVLMQQQFSMKDRTWQSLKDRFNKRILPNISIYETEGLSKKIIDSFKKHYEAKSGNDSINKASQSVCIKEKNRFYTRKEKESIVKFIVENRRFNQIKGNQLFKTMARKMPNPKKRSWQSLKNTFKRYIMPNIDDYVTSKEILLKFKNAWMKKRKKKVNFRKQPPVHTSSETEDENTSTETEDGNTSTEEEEATSLLTRSVESIKKSKKQKFSSDKDSTSEISSMETEGSDATVEFQKSSIKSRDGIRRKLFNKSVELFEETPIITTRLTKDKKSCKNNNERTIVIGSQSTKKKLNNKSNCCQSNSLSPSTNSTTKFTTVVEMEMSSPTKIIRSENLTSLLTRSKTKLSKVADAGVSSPTKTTILGTTPAPSPMTVLADTVPFSQTKITRSKVFITSPQVITNGLDPSDQSITQHPEKKDKLQINVDSPIAALNSPYTKLNSPNTKFNSPNTKLNSPNTKLNSPNTKLNSHNTKLNSPNTKLNSHNTKLNSPNTKLNSPNTKLNSPNTKLNPPNTKLNSPNTKLNSPNTKLNSPNTKLNSPNTKLNSPNTKLSSPNTKLNSPRPNTKLNSPNTKLNSPNTKLNSPNTKLNSPNTKLNSPNTKLNSPNTKLNSPNTNLNSPNIELNSSNTKLDLSITKSSGSTTKYFTRRNRPTEKFDKLCGSDSSSDSSCELPDCSKAGNNKKISLRSNLRILKRKSSK